MTAGTRPNKPKKINEVYSGLFGNRQAADAHIARALTVPTCPQRHKEMACWTVALACASGWPFHEGNRLRDVSQELSWRRRPFLTNGHWRLPSTQLRHLYLLTFTEREILIRCGIRQLDRPFQARFTNGQTQPVTYIWPLPVQSAEYRQVLNRKLSANILNNIYNKEIVGLPLRCS